MKANTRFPVAVHILALAAMNTSTPTTSELLARSVNTNPVVIRRTMSLLKKAGLIEVRPGAMGIKLARNPESISLLDIYRAATVEKKLDVFPLHCEPNQRCYVGRAIHEALAEPLQVAQNAMEEALGRYNLADVVASIRAAG